MIKNSGFLWHFHHNGLLGYCVDLEARILQIKHTKPELEVKLWLNLMKFVEGELPEDLLEAGQRYDEAGFHTIMVAPFGSKRDKKKAQQEYVESRQNYFNLLKQHHLVIEQLHKSECGCSWDGESIFNKKGSGNDSQSKKNRS